MTATERRSFGHDLYSLIGPELVRNSVYLSALATAELPWGQAAMACKMACEAAARAALSLRTFSESTGRKIEIELPERSDGGESSVTLYECLGVLVHHRTIEITLDPPLLRRSPSKSWISTAEQSTHRFMDMIVESDRRKIHTDLRTFANAVADEISHQLNSPEGRELRNNARVAKSNGGQ